MDGRAGQSSSSLTRVGADGGVQDPGSPPLELARYVREGKNVLRITQLGDLSDRFFLLTAGHADPAAVVEDDVAHLKWEE